MTKEMAINILRGDVLGTNEQTHEAVFMAIKALKEKAQVDNDRLIWESEIKKREHDVVLKDGAKHRCFDTTMLTEIPTVNAEPVKHGHWDDMGDFEQCSVCHGTHLKEYQTYYGKCLWVKTDYCPHCGAKMDEHIDTPTDPEAK